MCSSFSKLPWMSLELRTQCFCFCFSLINLLYWLGNSNKYVLYVAGGLLQCGLVVRDKDQAQLWKQQRKVWIYSQEAGWGLVDRTLLRGNMRSYREIMLSQPKGFLLNASQSDQGSAGVWWWWRRRSLLRYYDRRVQFKMT